MVQLLFFKLRLGALILRSVCLSVGRAVGLSSKNYKKITKLYKTFQNLYKTFVKAVREATMTLKPGPPLKNEDDLKNKVNESIFYR